MAIQLCSRTAGLADCRRRPGRSIKMSPRPRETSDEKILAAAARVIQRFGTKRQLLLATCKTGPADIAAQFAAARAKYKSPLKALVELFVECTGFASTPESMANGLAYLQIDLTDPEFRP